MKIKELTMKNSELNAKICGSWVKYTYTVATSFTPVATDTDIMVNLSWPINSSWCNLGPNQMIPKSGCHRMTRQSSCLRMGIPLTDKRNKNMKTGSIFEVQLCWVCGGEFFQFAAKTCTLHFSHPIGRILQTELNHSDNFLFLIFR